MFKWTRNAVCTLPASSFSSRHWGKFRKLRAKRRWEQKPVLEWRAGRCREGPRWWERQLRALHGQAGAATLLPASFEIMPIISGIIRFPLWLFRPSIST